MGELKKYKFETKITINDQKILKIKKVEHFILHIKVMEDM